MPSLLRIGPYRFFFFSKETGEPPHVHIASNNPPGSAKFWLTDLTLAESFGYDARHIRTILGILTQHRASFLRTWNEYFSLTENQ